MKINNKFKKKVLKESKKLILEALNKGILDETFKGLSITFHTDKAPQYPSYTIRELTNRLDEIKDSKNKKLFYKRERDAIILLIANLFPSQLYVEQFSAEVERHEKFRKSKNSR